MQKTKKCKVFVPYGALGLGISAEAFEKGIELNPDIISFDAGSTDSGPYYLGKGECKYARDILKADMKPVLVAADKLSIPVTIGSAGTGGTDATVDELYTIVQELCGELGLSFKIARIYTEQDSARMAEYYRHGRVTALAGAPAISEETFAQCSHIVGLAGVEPFQEALNNGADIVICGRSTDTAIIAAYPIMCGCNEALCWHAAKTVECGCICTTDQFNGGVFITIDESSFTAEATAPGAKCTPYSISSHMLYENANPIVLTEPGVAIDTSGARYEQLDNGRVRVTGTTLQRIPYTIKLEGAGRCGYQSVAMVGVRDRQVMQDPQYWVNGLDEFVQGKLASLNIDASQYQRNFNIYGYNGTYGGRVPEGFIPNEVLVMLRVTAKSQQLANRIIKVYNPYLLHFPVDRSKPMPSFAFPFSPAEIERGEVYEFKLAHLVQVESYKEMCRIEYDYQEAN